MNTLNNFKSIVMTLSGWTLFLGGLALVTQSFIVGWIVAAVGLGLSSAAKKVPTDDDVAAQSEDGAQ